VVLNIAETDYACDYIRHNGNKAEFLAKFAGAMSPDFDPDLHLASIGVANQNHDAAQRDEEISGGATGDG